MNEKKLFCLSGLCMCQKVMFKVNREVLSVLK
jgi:hypothetical protein